MGGGGVSRESTVIYDMLHERRGEGGVGVRLTLGPVAGRFPADEVTLTYPPPPPFRDHKLNKMTKQSILSGRVDFQSCVLN